MLYIILTITISFSVISADSPSAMQKCRDLHHVDIEETGTNYLNYKCKLVCNVHRSLFDHIIPDGRTCPDLVGTQYSNWTCKGGECVAPPSSLGYIDVKIVSAELNQRGNIFAEVFIQNNTNPVMLPITRKSPGWFWTTPIIPSTKNPVWSFITRGTRDHIWSIDSELIFQLWDHVTSTYNNYIGGGIVTIQHLISGGNNNKAIIIPINGGIYSAKITAHVTWTPLK
jgi:hypothetical protein